MLVSGFNDRLPLLPQQDAFSAPRLAYERLIRLTNHRLVIGAEDEAIVPQALDLALAELLDAGGFTRLPLLLQLVLDFASS